MSEPSEVLTETEYIVTRLAIIIALFLCFFIGSCEYKDYLSERNVVEVVKTGANVNAARCAIYGQVNGHELLCAYGGEKK
jgi:hypothetical protein